MKNKINFAFYDFKLFKEFLDTLPSKDSKKLISTINLVKEKGLLVSEKMKWTKKLDKNLFELRSKQSTNIQRAIYFHYENNNYVITHGFTKKTQKTPAKEINKGKKLRDNYLKSKTNKKPKER